MVASTSGLPWELPRAMTPARVAVAGVTLFAAVVTPVYLFDIEPVSACVGGPLPPRAAVVVITAAAGAGLATLLRGATAGSARWFGVFGGALTGVMTAWAGWAATALLGAGGDAHVAEVTVGGGLLGVAYGAAIGPILRATASAREAPGRDAVERVLFATGAAILVACAVISPFAKGSTFAATSADEARRLAAARPLALWIGVGVGGALAAFAALRVGALAWLEGNARSGKSARYEVTARTDHPDEAALLPLVAPRAPLTGVLVRRGVASPHRGERGAVKIALVPAAGGACAWLSRLGLPILFEALGVAFALSLALIPFLVVAGLALLALPWDVAHG